MKRKITPCAAVKAGEVTCRGQTTIEWYDADKDPQKYCYGYTDKMTDEYLDVCRNCPDFVEKAYDDMRQQEPWEGEKE